MLFTAVFLGYMLALFQRRVRFVVRDSEENEEHNAPAKPTFRPSTYQRQVRSALIPTPDCSNEETTRYVSFGNKLFNRVGSFLLDHLFGGDDNSNSNSSNKPNQYPMKSWPVQDSYVVLNEDVPPSVETRNPTPTSSKSYAFMSKYPESIRRACFNDLDGDLLHKQPQHQHLQQQRHYPSEPETRYEKSCETTKEIVFGAVQEGAATVMEIKAVDYGFPTYGYTGLYGGCYYNNY